jgi:catechol 2,3-dioxygenase-like lactoylglutathione lyase family enzyme
MAGITPGIRVKDMKRSLAFYQDLLGFRNVREETPEHNSLERGDARLMLEALAGFYAPGYNESITLRINGRSAIALYIEAPDLDELHDRLVARGVEIIDPIADRPWGQREFTVEDPDGTWLAFYRPLPQGV